MTKHLAIKDDVYNELNAMKPDEDRSFSFVIKLIMDENKDLKEEVQRKDIIIKKLTNGEKVDVDGLMTKDYVKKCTNNVCISS